MIKNNLAKLLIDRNIKATKLAKDTGIARSTISKIANNQTGKIDFSTLNILCSYLKIAPQQFFSYIPIDFEYSIQFTEVSIWQDEDSIITPTSVCNFDFFIDIKDHKNNEQKDICMNGTIKFDDTSDWLGVSHGEVHLKYDTDSDKETFEHYQNMIEIAFYPIIKKDIKNYLTTQISKELSKSQFGLYLVFFVPNNFIDNDFIN